MHPLEALALNGRAGSPQHLCQRRRCSHRGVRAQRAVPAAIVRRNNSTVRSCGNSRAASYFRKRARARNARRTRPRQDRQRPARARDNGSVRESLRPATSARTSSERAAASFGVSSGPTRRQLPPLQTCRLVSASSARGELARAGFGGPSHGDNSAAFIFKCGVNLYMGTPQVPLCQLRTPIVLPSAAAKLLPVLIYAIYTDRRVRPDATVPYAKINA